MTEISTTYDQSKESELYKLWESSGYFNPDNLSGKPFTIMMPPPNATGTLHIGHAFESTLQDVLIRYHRMNGEKALWLPGTDHAAIATNTKVEKILMKEQDKNRHDIGREAFVKMVEDFVSKSRGTIQNQIRKIGASADWSREAFTLDEPRSLAVKTAFKHMYDAGLIYRGIRVINWDPKGQTAVSDDEVKYRTEKGEFYTFKYSPDFPISIATTRPETKVGDVAVAVHPKDPRYKKFIGKEYLVDFAGAKLKIKIVADEAVDPKFGTGAVGVTPAHSMVDYEISQRHNLPAVQIINEHARMTPVAGSLVAGLKTKEARTVIVTWLKEKNLLEKIEITDINISVAERSGGVIEPLPKLQWFVSVDKNFKIKNSNLKNIKPGQDVTLKQLMQQVVKNGQIKIVPDRFKKIYFHWINNLRDWNISRQLWYGHRIPVWYCGLTQSKRMGFHPDTVKGVVSGIKTKTYRINDHNFKIGDLISFDSEKKNFGFGQITAIEHLTIKDLPLQDPAHGAVYKTKKELLLAFKRHYSADVKINATTPVIIYTYKFIPFSDTNVKNGCGQIINSIEELSACPACGNKNLTQDPDTLDTWFSSALWTFSTLGWPKETPDLKNFHPTDVMAPGYEILFFWVARMILMSTFLLGEIPFKTVYLHGMVRDIQGQKFSKSLDNGVDPIEVIEQYGADALRMGLIVGVGAGNDSKFDLQKIKGYRNFANKIWNVARFVLQNASNYPSPLGEGGRRPREVELTKADQKILKDFEKLEQKITKQLDRLDFAHAAEDLYHYFWHTFADKIIEEAKNKLADPKSRQSAQIMLKTVLENSLRMLHPFMPFVTEAVWQLNHNKLLMIEPWPGKTK